MPEAQMGIAGDLTNMARVYKAMGEFADAKDALERAYAIYVQLRLKKEIHATRDALGSIPKR